MNMLKRFKSSGSVKIQLTILSVVLLFIGASESKAQNTSGGSAEDAQIFNTGANQGRIVIDFETMSIPDWIYIYYPPRNEANSTRIYDWNGSTSMLPNGVHHIDITFGPGQSQNVEVVVNEGSQSSWGTWWGYSGTITGRGQRPVVINGGQPITTMQPPTVNTGTGRIFNPTPTGGGGRSIAGTKGGGASKHNPRRTTSRPTQRKGYVGRIIGPTTNVRLNKAGPTRTAQPNPQGSRSNTSMPKPNNVLFSGKGSMMTYIRKIPTRSVRRVVLRGGRPR